MIAVDWGTSSLRVFRLAGDGRIIDSRHSDNGVLAAAGRFEQVLVEQIDGWDDALIVMTGMVGSRQGWHEVPYVDCPAGLDEIAAGMQRLQSYRLEGRDLWITPGLSARRSGDLHDLMRGEETQVCGLLDDLPPGDLYVCLAGTHSKHVRVADGRITALSTLMTGEMYEVLCQHSILGRLMQPGPHHEGVFKKGVDMAAAGNDLLADLFAVRTQGVLGYVNGAWLQSYLSGILIGHELNAIPAGMESVHLVASSSLQLPYRTALARRGFKVVVHAESCAARGLHALAARRGLAGVAAT